MITQVVRKARKAHACDGCRGPIRPGDAYLTHTALAGDDYYHDALDRDTLKPANCPIRTKECGSCATRYGRGSMFTEPSPEPTERPEPVVEIEGQLTIEDAIEGGEHGLHEEAARV